MNCNDTHKSLRANTNESVHLKKYSDLCKKIVGILLFSSLVFAQQNKECVTHTSLTIEPVVQFCEDMESPIIVPELLYGIPHIAPEPITICYETNSPLSALYLESPDMQGNLFNGSQNIQTFYLMTESHTPPTSLDPRWKRGDQLGQFLKKADRPGKYQYQLYIRLFADSTCGFGHYQNQLNIIVIDNLGLKHSKSVGIQTHLDEASLEGRLRQQRYRPELDPNINKKRFMEFIVTDDVLEIELEPHPGTNTLVGHVPLQFYTNQDHLPCTLALETTNLDNYFHNESSRFCKTFYQLTPAHIRRYELDSRHWVDGRDIGQCAYQFTQNGYHALDLWISFHPPVTTTLENTITLVLTDAHGKTQMQNLRIIARRK